MRKGMPMKSQWTMGLLAVAIAGIAAGTAGCGSEPAYVSEEDSYKIREEPGQDHIIGFDTTGFPVYGVDEDGKPIYKPLK